MESSELRRKMMQLWQRTFHDSPEYVSLVFDNYFNPDLVEYHEIKGEIVSALLALPYEFGNADNCLKGLYLCGLSTDPSFRHKGLMNELIENINKRGAGMGYAFSFLIPADEELINYYSRHGYVNAMYRVEDRYTSVHDFRNDYINCIEKEDKLVRNLKIKRFDMMRTESLSVGDNSMIDNIIEYIYNYEHQTRPYYSLLHSKNDIKVCLIENEMSNGDVVISMDNSGVISGVAFTYIDDKRRVVVPKVYYNDSCSFFSVLNFLKKKYPDYPVSVFAYPEETDRRGLIMDAYIASNPDGANLESVPAVAERVYSVCQHAKPYGMVRVLDNCEILKFLAVSRGDAKFSILVKDGFNADIAYIYEVGGGSVKCRRIDGREVIRKISGNPNYTILSQKEMMEVIFRKKEGSNVIMEAFGIPRLILNMSLLLD